MRILAAGVIALCLIVADFMPASASASIYESVRPMTMLRKVPETGESVRHQGCTAFAVKWKSRVLWVSADHCVEDEDLSEIMIGSSPATIIKQAIRTDVSILTGEPAPGLTVASEEVEIGSAISTVGYPYGWPFPAVRQGIRSSFQVRGAVVLGVNQFPAGPGDSGAPVFNKKQQVIGLMKSVFCENAGAGFCAMSASVTLADLRAALEAL